MYDWNEENNEWVSYFGIPEGMPKKKGIKKLMTYGTSEKLNRWIWFHEWMNESIKKTNEWMNEWMNECKINLYLNWINWWENIWNSKDSLYTIPANQPTIQ